MKPKTKTGTLAVILMLLVYISPDLIIKTKAAVTKTIPAHAGVWTIHGIYKKACTYKYVYATNYSGYGEFGYCYAQLRVNFYADSWQTFSGDYRIYKNDSEYTLAFYNTVDIGTEMSLRLKGLIHKQGTISTGQSSNAETYTQNFTEDRSRVSESSAAGHRIPFSPGYKFKYRDINYY